MSQQEVVSSNTLDDVGWEHGFWCWLEKIHTPNRISINRYGYVLVDVNVSMMFRYVPETNSLTVTLQSSQSRPDAERNLTFIRDGIADEINEEWTWDTMQKNNEDGSFHIKGRINLDTISKLYNTRNI